YRSLKTVAFRASKLPPVTFGVTGGRSARDAPRTPINSGCGRLARLPRALCPRLSLQPRVIGFAARHLRRAAPSLGIVRAVVMNRLRPSALKSIDLDRVLVPIDAIGRPIRDVEVTFSIRGSAIISFAHSGRERCPRPEPGD